MGLTKFMTNVNNIQDLSDKPNEIDGLTSAELKAKFDKAGADIKSYINGTLTEEIDTKFSEIPGTISSELSALIQQIREVEYPIGRIVEFYDNSDHSTFLGFSWERCMVGKTPIGLDTNDSDFNVIGKTGGEKTHKLTTTEIPKHNHGSRTASGETHFHYQAVAYANGVFGTSGTEAASSNGAPYMSGGDKLTFNYAHTHDNVGGDGAHNNLQPYEVISYWKRIG